MRAQQRRVAQPGHLAEAVRKGGLRSYPIIIIDIDRLTGTTGHAATRRHLYDAQAPDRAQRAQAGGDADGACGRRRSRLQPGAGARGADAAAGGWAGAQERPSRHLGDAAQSRRGRGNPGAQAAHGCRRRGRRRIRAHRARHRVSPCDFPARRAQGAGADPRALHPPFAPAKALGAAAPPAAGRDGGAARRAAGAGQGAGRRGAGAGTRPPYRYHRGSAAAEGRPMTPYVDPDMLPILEAMRAAPPIDYTAMPIEAARDVFEQGMAPWNALSPQNLLVEDLTIGGAAGPLRARLFRPDAEKLPLIVFVHGGGWTFGSVDSHQ